MSRLQPFSFMPSAPASAPAGIRAVGVPSVHSYTRALENEESAGGPRRKPPVHTCARLKWHSKESIQFKWHGSSQVHTLKWQKTLSPTFGCGPTPSTTSMTRMPFESSVPSAVFDHSSNATSSSALNLPMPLPLSGPVTTAAAAVPRPDSGQAAASAAVAGRADAAKPSATARRDGLRGETKASALVQRSAIGSSEVPSVMVRGTKCTELYQKSCAPRQSVSNLEGFKFSITY